jgi:hypothetical protein
MRTIKNLSKLNKNNKEFLRELTKYKKKFVNSILSLNFALLIQMPFAITVIYIFMGIEPYNLIIIVNISILSLIFLLFYFKIRLYISSFYNKILRRFEVDEFE